MYNEKVMEAFKNPKNVGEIENPSGIGTVGNASCGDIMQISLKIENNIIFNQIKAELSKGNYTKVLDLCNSPKPVTFNFDLLFAISFSICSTNTYSFLTP